MNIFSISGIEYLSALDTSRLTGVSVDNLRNYRRRRTDIDLRAEKIAGRVYYRLSHIARYLKIEPEELRERIKSYQEAA